MPLHHKLPSDLTEFDVIIAGGGLAGCVIAGRLAEADRELSILVIEQGPNNYNAPEVVYPALYPRNLWPSSKFTLFHQGKASKELAGRSPIVPSGGTLGGGSAINWMVYTRGQRSDFDSWKTEGWSADELKPFLNKLETYHGYGKAEDHGHNGPTIVSKGSHRAKGAEDDFLKATETMGYKVRPTEAEVEALGPEFKAAWDKDFKNAKDRPLMIMALYNCYYGDHSVLPDGAEYVSLANWTTYPYSRGHIHITGPSMHDKIDFDTGWLQDANSVDVKKHIWAYKVAREVFRRMSIFRGELKGNHPNFPEGSKAAVLEYADGPTAKGADDRIEYTKEDDAALEQKIRETVSTTWHSLGTAKMAPRDQKGVVDASLNVHGIEGLKLADLSVPPENVGANTGNTAFVVGEKAADIIIKELGLEKVDSPRM